MVDFMTSSKIDVKKCLDSLPDAQRRRLFQFIRAHGQPSQFGAVDETAYLRNLLEFNGAAEIGSGS